MSRQGPANHLKLLRHACQNVFPAPDHSCAVAEQRWCVAERPSWPRHIWNRGEGAGPPM